MTRTKKVVVETDTCNYKMDGGIYDVTNKNNSGCREEQGLKKALFL